MTNPNTNTIEDQEDEQKLISYTYDDSGNIETITHPDGKVITYYYDELNQLIREDNQIINKTIDYTYDAGGNIQTKVESDYSTGTEREGSREYRYGYDTAWKDKLVEYDGKAFEYDLIGNIINDSEYAYTWEQGRRLSSMQKAGQNITFKYNAQGIRTEKTVNGVTTKYHLVGGKVTYETDGTDKIYYTYDSEDNLVSMNFNGIEYYYVYNAQGDIIALIDAAGNEVVSYTYDTWGKLLSIEGTLKDTVGSKNPYRYRSYRYDTETELYYLNSRYYNPEWGRFINADAFGGKVGALLLHNMFVYALNNPVNMDDTSGHWPTWIMGPLTVASGVTQVIAGFALGTTIGWTGIGAVAAAFLVANGIAAVASGLAQVSNKAWNTNLPEENAIRIASKALGKAIGKNTGQKVGAIIYDVADTASSLYSIGGGGRPSYQKLQMHLVKPQILLRLLICILSPQCLQTNILLKWD